MNHVTLWVPVLILTIAINLNELLENGSLTSIAALSKLRRVVIVAVNLLFVLIIAVLSAKYGWTHRAREVVDMVFVVKRRNVRSTKGGVALVAQETQTTKVVGFAQRVLTSILLVVDREEL